MVVVVDAEVAVAVAVASRHLQVLGGDGVAELPLYAQIEQQPQDRRDVPVGMGDMDLSRNVLCV